MLILIDAFVQTFGITKPTPAGARRAARVLGWILLAAVPALIWLAVTLARVALTR